jgi:ribosomal protein S17E
LHIYRLKDTNGDYELENEHDHDKDKLTGKSRKMFKKMNNNVIAEYLTRKIPKSKLKMSRLQQNKTKNNPCKFLLKFE